MGYEPQPFSTSFYLLFFILLAFIHGYQDCISTSDLSASVCGYWGGREPQALQELSWAMQASEAEDSRANPENTVGGGSDWDLGPIRGRAPMCWSRGDQEHLATEFPLFAWIPPSPSAGLHRARLECERRKRESVFLSFREVGRGYWCLCRSKQHMHLEIHEWTACFLLQLNRTKIITCEIWCRLRWRLDGVKPPRMSRDLWVRVATGIIKKTEL